MINELLMQKDQEETNKMLKAIHQQAKDNYYFEKGRKYLESINAKRNHKKRVIKDFFEELLLTTLGVIAMTLVILLLVVWCY